MKLFLIILLNHFLVQADGQKDFQKKMADHILQLPKGAKLSLQIQGLGTKNGSLFSHQPEMALYPASSTKLVTSALALEALGPAYTFETKVYLSGKNIILWGNGDPYLVSERLWLLARDVARSGIKQIDAIKINTSFYHEDYRGLEDWRDSGEPFTAVVAPVSVNFNSMEIHVLPRAGKKHPDVEPGPYPHNYGKIVNEVSLNGGQGKQLSVRASTKNGEEVFTVTGSIGAKSPPAIVYAAVKNPEAYMAHVFAALLRKEGIEIKQEYGGEEKSAPKGQEIANLESLPLQDLLRLSNTYSNNFMTEQVYQAIGAKIMGGRAYLEGAKEQANKFLQQQDLCRTSFIENGSGLSWNTKISADCFVEILQKSFSNFSNFADLLGSLPIGGNTGTLKSRFKNSNKGVDAFAIRAKTGTIWSKEAVTSLVGITKSASGKPVVFSILLNNPNGKRDELPALRSWEDKCVEYIQQLYF